MKKLTIEPGCITCGACEYISPEVFAVTDICRVKPDADLEIHETAIKEAVLACPVSVINFKNNN